MIESALNISAGQNELPLEGARLESGDADRWAEYTRDIVKNGDKAAFAKYYETFFDTMFQTVKRATGCDEATCLDIVQDAMLKAISKMKVLQSRDHATAWTKVVAKTTAYDFLRRQLRRKKLTENLPAPDTTDSPGNAGTDSDTESLARVRWIEEQLQQLPAELSSMISMKYRMGWTLRQIGESFGLKTGAVDGKIRRAIDDLKTRATREFDDE